jgi:CRP/FNR family transcriptional regulator, cyclic AMP receptor protein
VVGARARLLAFGQMTSRVDATDDVRQAISFSNLRALGPNALERLFVDARLSRLEAGRTLHPEGWTEAHFELVVSGLVRVYVAARDGRTLTVRYCRAGAILGAVSVFGRDFTLPATIQAIVDTRIVRLRPEAVRASVRADPAVADAVLAELSERIEAFIVEIRQGAFTPVRQRVARHVLDLATDSQRSGELQAAVSQAELAAACGTVREAVGRVLGEFRADHLIETRRGLVEVLDPAAMVAIALGEDSDRDG